MRVMIPSFEEWYANQSVYKKVDGPDAKTFSKRSIVPVDEGRLSPSYLLKSPSFDDKMMEIKLK